MSLATATDETQESLNQLNASLDKLLKRKEKLEALGNAVRHVVTSGRVISKSDPVTEDDWLSIIEALAEVDALG